MENIEVAEKKIVTKDQEIITESESELLFRRSRSPNRGRRRDSRSGSRGRDDGRSNEFKEGRFFLSKEKGHIKVNCDRFRDGRGRYQDRREPCRNDRYSRSLSPRRDRMRMKRNYSSSRYRSPPRRRRDE